MAYVPPHKRHPKNDGRPSPIPELLVPQFSKNLRFRSPHTMKEESGKIVHAKRAISGWFALGLDDDDQFSSYVHLQPVPLEHIEGKDGEKPLILVNSLQPEEKMKLMRDVSRKPWAIIAEKVLQDLLSSFENLKTEMEHQGLEKVKPSFVARLGKVLFHGIPSVRFGNAEKNQVAEAILRRSKRSFHPNFPSSYVENIIDGVIGKIGINFQGEKDVYHVKLYDNTRPGATVKCKCRVRDGKLLLFKFELNLVRYMLKDISCLEKDLDLRLILSSKKILTALTDDEMSSIGDLINSAELEPHRKGGLRWPLGEMTSDGRFSVIGAWHTISRSYESSSFRLKIRHADRFDFMTGTGEISREIYVKMKRLVSELQQDQSAGSDLISNLLEDSLRVIWENFLCCDQFWG